MKSARIALGVLAILAAMPALAEDPPSVAVQTEKPRDGVVPDLLVAYGSAAPALDRRHDIELSARWARARHPCHPGRDRSQRRFIA